MNPIAIVNKLLEAEEFDPAAYLQSTPELSLRDFMQKRGFEEMPGHAEWLKTMGTRWVRVKKRGALWSFWEEEDNGEPTGPVVLSHAKGTEQEVLAELSKVGGLWEPETRCPECGSTSLVKGRVGFSAHCLECGLAFDPADPHNPEEPGESDFT